MGNHFVGCAVHQHLAVIDDVGAIDQAERLAHIVVGDQHADAARRQVVDQRLDVADGDRVDARERLVEQDERGAAGQRPGDFAAPAFTARQRNRRRFAQPSDPEFFQERVELLLAAAFVWLHQLQHGHDVLLDREPTEDRGLLRQIADA